MSATVTRIVHDDGHICYGIGGNEPLNLSQVADLIATEWDLCYRAFAAFQTLVEEQCVAIAALEEQRCG